VVEDTRGPAENFIPLRNAANYDLSQTDPTRHPRWDHIVNIVDRNGKLIESWEQHNKLFVRPHRVLINPYDPERHIWLVDDGAHSVYKFTNDVDSDGNLYTADVHVGRPQKFRPKPGANKAQLIGAPARGVN